MLCYVKIIQIQKDTGNFDKLHPSLPYYQAEVIYHLRYEMAHTLEDVLARRIRALFLDAKATLECAELTASIMAKELGENQEWIDKQLEAFYLICKGYLP